MQCQDTDLWLTLEELDNTEELHGAVIDLAGLQVLHVLGPQLPLLRRRKVHRTAVATMSNLTGHLYYRSTLSLLGLSLFCTHELAASVTGC